jgi:hypothetical protein
METFLCIGKIEVSERMFLDHLPIYFISQQFI